MRFLRSISFILCVLSATAARGIPAVAGTDAKDAMPAPAVSEAKERNRRAELLSIHKDLTDIYAFIAREDISELERSRRLAPIAARYEDLLSRFPDDAETLVLYAKFLRDGGDDAGAREHFEKVRKIRPDWAVAYQQLAAISAERGDGAGAFPQMKKAVEIEPGTLAYQLQFGELIATFRADLLENKIFETRRELDRAMQDAFRAARALAPNSLDIAVRYAESFYDVETPDWRAALGAWEHVQKINENAARVGTNLAAETLMRETIALHKARVFAELGEFARAEQILCGISDERLNRSRDRIRKIISEKRKLTDKN